MIQIREKKSVNGNIIGFHLSGHAGFSQYGTDVVCAGVSALVINCINSVEEFTDTEFDLIQNEEDGLIDFTCKEPVDEKALLLIQSTLYGLSQISESYGSKYVTYY